MSLSRIIPLLLGAAALITVSIQEASALPYVPTHAYMDTSSDLVQHVWWHHGWGWHRWGWHRHWCYWHPRACGW